jgi:hypothetical protein
MTGSRRYFHRNRDKHEARMKMPEASKRERRGDGYREQYPGGRGALDHSLQCWPSGTDPRPRIGEPR